MSVVFETPKSLIDVPMHFCPGCSHGVIHRLVAEVIDEMEIMNKTIGVTPVGCSVYSYDYFGVRCAIRCSWQSTSCSDRH